MTLAGEIEAFGQRLGLQGLRLGEAGAATLRIDGDLTLTLQKGEGNQSGSLLVTLAVPVSSAEAPDLYERCLERASVDAAPAMPFSVGLARDRLVFGVRLREKAVAAAALENALRFLLGLVPAA